MRQAYKSITKIWLTAFLSLVLAVCLRAPSSAQLPADHKSSDEVIEPREITRNPFQLKGHDGILDTVRIGVSTLEGVGYIPMPGRAMTFKSMLDEHTAIYEVFEERSDFESVGELAVLLPDSDPPDTRHLWRVRVLGPIKVTNAFGVTLRVTSLRFDGYYVAPVKAAEKPALPDSDGIYQVGGRVSAPVILRQEEPEFTTQAAAAHVEGSVLLAVTIGIDGRPTKIRVARSLGYGLDESAVQAVAHYTFKPALLEGKPVPVKMNIEVPFQDLNRH